MIYNVQVKNSYGANKTFFMSADSKQKLYKRIMHSYSIPKEEVEILEEYEDTPDWGYKLKKSYIKHLSEDTKNLTSTANQLFSKAKRLSDPNKTKKVEKYNYNIIDIDTEANIVPLLEKYNTVKVYWDLGEKRGSHKYYALVK